MFEFQSSIARGLRVARPRLDQGFLYSHGVYTTIVVQGSDWTQPQAINDAGRIVGYYMDNSGGPAHGFLYSGGVYTTIEPPGSFASSALTINASGEILGYCWDYNSKLEGFLYSKGVYTTIDAPGST